jgi:predicted RND superfamily exporter protein
MEEMMIYMTKRIILFSMVLLIVLSSVFTGGINVLTNAHSSTVSDNITTGTMDSYSNDYIIVNNVRYGFCTGIEIFNKKGEELLSRDLDAALEVQLYEGGGCVNKIIVLRFAH